MSAGSCCASAIDKKKLFFALFPYVMGGWGVGGQELGVRLLITEKTGAQS